MLYDFRPNQVIFVVLLKGFTEYVVFVLLSLKVSHRVDLVSGGTKIYGTEGFIIPWHLLK